MEIESCDRILNADILSAMVNKINLFFKYSENLLKCISFTQMNVNLGPETVYSTFPVLAVKNKKTVGEFTTGNPNATTAHIHLNYDRRYYLWVFFVNTARVG